MQPRNEMLTAMRDAIRNPYTWPGGYPVHIYLSDGECICADCARLNYRRISESTRSNNHDGWAVLGIEVFWEGPPEYCVQCNKEMESAYGE